MSARLIIGDVFDVLASLEPGSVDLVMTSPPFLALRSYLPADHPDKGKEIGSEATPADFLDTLLDVVEALDRVLAPHGSIVVELGDTYAGSGGAGGDYGEGGLRNGQERFGGSARKGRDRNRKSVLPPGPHSAGGGLGWPLDKSLCGIPTLFAWSLAYGRNLLRPERTTPQWRIRNVVAWCRPNPPVGALGDKVRPATSYLTIATKTRNRYFDLDAVRVPSTTTGGSTSWHPADHRDKRGDDKRRHQPNTGSNPAGAPPLDYWVIPTQPYSESHYATFPEKLCEIPIKSMCPQRVCTVCGQPSRRITERSEDYAAARAAIGDFNQRKDGAGVSGSRSVLAKAAGRDITAAENITVGWTECDCTDPSGDWTDNEGNTWDGYSKWRTGTVLDPFAGSGTTLAVATGHGRDAIGVDLDERNAELALGRVGPLMLTVEHHDSRKGAA